MHCPKSENHLGFKVPDGPDHSLRCPKNETHLGFKVKDVLDHSLHCQKGENHLGFILANGPDLYSVPILKGYKGDFLKNGEVSASLYWR